MKASDMPALRPRMRIFKSVVTDLSSSVDAILALLDAEAATRSADELADRPLTLPNGELRDAFLRGLASAAIGLGLLQALGDVTGKELDAAYEEATDATRATYSAAKSGASS